MSEKFLRYDIEFDNGTKEGERKCSDIYAYLSKPKTPRRTLDVLLTPAHLRVLYIVGQDQAGCLGGLSRRLTTKTAQESWGRVQVIGPQSFILVQQGQSLRYSRTCKALVHIV